MCCVRSASKDDAISGERARRSLVGNTNGEDSGVGKSVFVQTRRQMAQSPQLEVGLRLSVTWCYFSWVVKSVGRYISRTPLGSSALVLHSTSRLDARL